MSAHAAGSNFLANGLLLPAALLLGLGTVLAAELGLVRLPTAPTAISAGIPQTVTVAPRDFAFRPAGDFLVKGRPVDPPLTERHRTEPLEIMKFEVSAADYALCVSAGGCKPAAPALRGTGNVPVTGVNFYDAEDYARWLSQQTGESWRLPTVEEWSFAAGDLARDHGRVDESGSADFAQRWIASYDAAFKTIDPEEARPRALGSFGTGPFGLADIGGNVWEWMADCNARTQLSPSGTVVSRIESCGVRTIEGNHRMALTAFIRDAKGGGCSVNVPPDNLGFRLVRERPWWAPLAGIGALFRL